MTLGRGARLALRIATAIVLVFIYVPLTLVVIYAFNESGTSAWPPSGFTLDWVKAALDNTGLQEAFLTSIVVALCATGVAMLLGALASLAVARYSFFGRETVSFVLVLAIALPGVVTGMALSTAMAWFHAPLGFFTIVVGHATFCIVLVYNNAIARLRRISSSLEEASADLGADGFQTFRHVTFPALRSAFVAGGLLAFALSFDEVIVTTFTAGAQTTLPIFILNNINRGTQLPVINVVAFVVILLTVIPVWASVRLTHTSGLSRRN